MFDLGSDTTAMESMMLAQATTPPAVVAPPPNWIGNDPGLLKYFERSLKDPAGFKSQFYQYEERGPLGKVCITRSRA